jgi:predicted Zn-dependent protease
MPKSNLKALKQRKRRGARANGKIRLNPSRKASNGSAIPFGKFSGERMLQKNTRIKEPAFAEPAFQRLLEQSLSYKNAKDFTAAAKTLLQLVHVFPDSPIANWLLGATLLYELSKPRRALSYLKKAVHVDPESERCSLALFHCLWRLDRVPQALEEMKRFQILTNWSCHDYLEIAAELKTKWLHEQPNHHKR